MKNRTLYFGDNLDILRKKIPDKNFDLIYLDPPFNSNRSYNVLFKEGLQDSPAQVKAFEDSWHWTQESKQVFDLLVRETNEGVSNLMLALEKMIGHNDMLAYLTMMTVRMIELHRVLKTTGSIYLHCDPTASHYLKLILDAIFDKKNFRNEIVWCYRGGGVPKKDFANRHDIIFRYPKGTASVAERLKRNWVGIDITTLAINLIKRRLRDQFNLVGRQIYVDGLPTDLAGAKALFKKDPFEFEYWALDLINAMPAKSKSKENMRGADRGIDGVITFHKNILNNNGHGANGKNGNGNGRWEYGKVIVQVKGGGVQRSHIATLKGDIERENADAGVFITLEKPTRQMILEAVDAGEFTTPITAKYEFPKIKILTIEELLRNKQPNLPHGLIKNYHKEAKPVDIDDDNSIQKELVI